MCANSSRNLSSSRLDVSITTTTPDTVTTGELFTIDGRVSFNSDVDGDLETVTVTIDFIVDSEQIGSTTIQLTETNSKTRSKEYALNTTGSHTVTVSAEATIDGSTHTSSDSKTIDASSADTELSQAHGAGFAVPDSMQDEVDSYRSQFYIDLPYAFILARPNELYLVFCNQEPTPSEAVVSGAPLLNQLPVSATENITFDVVVATDTSFITTGDPATVSDVHSSPSSYAFDLVRINDHHERVSTLYDPDSGNNITVSSTLGLLKQTASSKALDEPGTKSRELSRQVRELVGDLRQKLQEFVSQNEPSLTTFNLDINYWTASNAIVDAIVLPSGSTARKFLAAFDKPGVTADSNGEPVLYVVQTSYSTTTYNSISSLKSNASDGDLVEITANDWFVEISAQETIEHSTECGDDQVKIDDACVNLVQDVLFEAGVLWTSLPQSTSDVLFVAGMSSKELDEPYKFKDAQYTFVGEVISATRFDPALPDVKMLVVYERRNKSPIDYASLADSAKEIIEDRGLELAGAVQRQIQNLSNSLTEEWAYSSENRIQHSAVAFDSGNTYLGGLGSTVRALDTSAQTVDWTYDRGGSLVDSAPTVDNGVVVIGGGDGQIYGLNASDLTEKWTYSTGSAMVSSPAVAGGVVFIGNNRGEVYAVDRDNGSLKWEQTVGSAIFSDPVVDGTKVYLTTNGGDVVALGTAGGVERWRYDVGTELKTSSPLVTSNSVFVAGEHLRSLSKTGSQKWSVQLDGRTASSPSIWDNTVYVGTDNGVVHAIDPDNQTEEWVRDVGSSGRTTVHAQNQLIFVTNGSSLKILDAVIGSPLTSTPVGGTVYAPPTVRNGKAYVLAGEQLGIYSLQSP